MKPRKQKPIMDGIEFDSKEEVEFYLWCKEAQKSGFLSSFEYHPDPFELSDAYFIEEPRQLKTKVKMVRRCLFRAHVYQPDFILKANYKFIAIEHGLRSFPFGHGTAFYIDIKPGFDPQDSRKALFAINKKWVYSKYGVYINKVVPKEFFAKTWAPDIRHKKTGRKLEKYAGCKGVQEAVNTPNELEFN